MAGLVADEAIDGIQANTESNGESKPDVVGAAMFFASGKIDGNIDTSVKRKSRRHGDRLLANTL